MEDKKMKKLPKGLKALLMVISGLLFLICSFGISYGMRESALWASIITPIRYILSVVFAGSVFVILWFRPDKNYSKMSLPMKIVLSVCGMMLVCFAYSALAEVLYQRRILPGVGEAPYVLLSGCIIYFALVLPYLIWREKH